MHKCPFSDAKSEPSNGYSEALQAAISAHIMILKTAENIPESFASKGFSSKRQAATSPIC
jgi:hypothetical protein